ncbi:MAG TPA: T9SS type A sorting domain-containing protein [bacterium]
MEGSVPGTTAQHNVGDLNCGLSDWGAVGSACGADPGFKFPMNSEEDHGYSGALVAGVWGKDVADSYGNLDDSEDDTWRPTSSGQFRMSTPGMISDQDGYAQFEKWLITPQGLTHVVVNQHSYAWASVPYDQFVLLDFDILNNGPYPLNNFVIGYLMDWDCQPDYETNEAKYDNDLKLAYMWDSGTTGNYYLGTVVLSQSPASFKIIRNRDSVYPQNDLPDQVMFDLMNTSGFMGSIGQGDLSTLIAVPQINLQPNRSARFTVALVAGYNLSDLRQSAAKAREKFNSIQNRRIAEIYYDDGTPESGVSVTAPGERLAVRFTPSSYPATLKFASFYNNRDSNKSLKLNIYDDNGSNGKPGTSLISSSVSVAPEPNSWNQVDLSSHNIRVNSGDFYISMEWVVADDPSIGYDEEFPYAGRSWYYDRSTWLKFADLGDVWGRRDLMIGAGLELTTVVQDEDIKILPKDYFLSQNYPNPFNSSTTISFALPKKELVILKIYDILGREVAILVNDFKEAGNYQVNFVCNGIASGLYIYEIQAGSYVAVKKMLYIR